MTTNKQRWTLVLTAMASFMVALDQLVVSTALDTIRRDLGASIEELEWTVNAYGLSFAVLLMPAAVLGDRLGRRRCFVGGLALFAAASAACALAPGIGWLIAARAVQGAGAAIVMPLAFTLLGVAVTAEARGKALGIFSAVTGLAVLGGPVVGGAIAEGLDWEWIFWLNVPVAAVVMGLAVARIDESTGVGQALDLAGLLLLGGGALGIVWGLVRGNAAGWGSAEVVAALAGGVLLTAAFVVWERRAAAPMLPMRLFADRAFAAGNAAAFFLFGSLFSAVFFLAQFLQLGLGFGPLEAGLGLMVWTGTLFVVAPIAGALVDRGAGRSLIVAGLLLHAGGMAWIALTAAPDLAYGSLIAPLAVAGCGISMAMPAVQGAVLGAVDPAQTGTASGVLNTLREIGGVMGIAVVVAVFAAAGSYTTPAAFTDGFGPALGVTAALGVAGALAGLAIPRGHVAVSEAAVLPAPVAAPGSAT